MIPGMLQDDEKPLAAMLAGPSKKEEETEEDETGNANETALTALSEDMMLAVKSNDARGFRVALDGFFEMKMLKGSSDI